MASRLRAILVRLRIMLAFGVMISVYAVPIHAEERQYKIEAAYLFNFFNYITWPGYDSPQALVNPTICVYANDPVIPYLDYGRQKLGDARNLTIKILERNDAVTGCNMVFTRDMVRLMRLPLPNDVLTVAEPSDPLDSGGMIELYEDETRISIGINNTVLADNGFQVSSRLLNLARRIE